MSDDLTALGIDGIRRSYDEHYDTMMDVEQDPTGAFFAIQEQADRINELEAKLEGQKRTIEAVTNSMDIETARGIVAQAWCQPETSNTEMDVVLAEEFAKILIEKTKDKGDHEPKMVLNRIEELEAENKALRRVIADVVKSTGDDPEIMAASREEWAQRAFSAVARIGELEAKLAKAVAAADRLADAVDDLRNLTSDEQCVLGLKRCFDRMKDYRTTLAELKGQDDE